MISRPAADCLLPPGAGTALSFAGRSGTGGQLGHGNDFDYWSPFHVEWLQLTETNWAKQQQEGGGELAWKVQQVGTWAACPLRFRLCLDSLAAMHTKFTPALSNLPPVCLLQVSCGLNHTAAIIELAPGVTC